MNLKEVFTNAANKWPDRIALKHTDKQMSYAELDRLSDGVVNFLLKLQLPPGSVIGVCLERNFDLIVSILGIIKSGHAYLIINSKYTSETINFIIKDALVPIIISDNNCKGLIEKSAIEVQLFEIEELKKETLQPLDVEISEKEIAYIVYTSGSTGMPKGVPITHANLVNLLESNLFNLDCTDCVSQIFNTSFDAFATEIWCTLAAGASLGFMPEKAIAHPEIFMRYLRQYKITTLKLTPALFNKIAPYLADSGILLKSLTLGGDIIDVKILKEFLHKRIANNIYNLYGPTEATCISTLHKISNIGEQVFGRISIGKPIAGAQAYILDEDMRLVPPGEVGELYLGGAGVAKGYWNRPELTAERFVPNPFSTDGADIIYRTGDFVRLLEDGNLDFIGRKDNQVKIRGYRIELEEVEKGLLKLPEVQEACVMVHHRSDGHKQLIAYISSKPYPLHSSSLELKSKLKNILPEYMIPSGFVFLESFPINSNGKIDRQKINEHFQAEGRREFTRSPFGQSNRVISTPSAISDHERILIEIWSKVLEIEGISPEDNFFSLGGDSIMAIDVVSRAGEQGLVLTERMLYESPTPRALAQAIESPAKSGKIPKIVSVEQSQGIFPLTPIQSWFIENEFKNPHYFHQIYTKKIKANLSRLELERIFKALVSKHAVFRARFAQISGQWKLKIDDYAPEVGIKEIDLSYIAEEDKPTRLQNFKQALCRLINVEYGPLLQIGHIKASGQKDCLMIVIHHAFVDGISWRLLSKDLDTLLAQLEGGEELSLQNHSISYPQWAQLVSQYAKSASVLEHKQFWVQQCEKPISIPYDYQLGPNNEASSACITVELEQESTNILTRHLLNATGTKINTVLLAAFLKSIHQWSGQNEVFMDLEGHGRENLFEGVDISQTLGWFTSLFPVYLKADKSLLESSDTDVLLKTVHAQLEAIPQKGIGYGILRYLTRDSALQEALTKNKAAIRFNYLGRFDTSFSKESLQDDAITSTCPLESANDAENNRIYDLIVESWIAGNRLSISCYYSCNRHKEGTIQELLRYFRDNLQELAALGGQASQQRLSGMSSEFPLSEIQQGFFFHKQYFPNSPTYHVQIRWKILGSINFTKLEQAWETLCSQHPVLKSRYHVGPHGIPYQSLNNDRQAPIVFQDWSGLSAEDQSTRLNKFLEENKLNIIDLKSDPIIRCACIRINENTAECLWSFYHILMDGWSATSLTTEFLEIYSAYLTDKEPVLLDRHSTKTHFDWLQKQDKQEGLRFWTYNLRGFEDPTTLAIQKDDITKFDERRSSIASHNSYRILLTEEISRLLVEGAKHRGVTLNTVFQTAWSYVLSLYSGSKDIVFGVTISARRPSLEGSTKIIGNLINSIPLRIVLDSQNFIDEFLKSVQSAMSNIAEHSLLPLTDIQHCSAISADRNLFESLLIFENYPAQKLKFQECQIRDLEVIESTEYPLTVFILPGERIQVHIAYNQYFYAQKDIEALTQSFLHICQELVSRDSQTSLSDISLVPEESKADLFALGAGPNIEISSEAGLAQTICSNITKSPDKIAIIQGETKISYRELDILANSLAKVMKDNGVERESKVAIFLERSPEVAIAILACLKLGAIYVPLSPDFPHDRLEYILSDCKPELILSVNQLVARLPKNSSKTTCLEQIYNPSQQHLEKISCVNWDPEKLINIMYTSGSTGKPKGVMVKNQGVLNFALWLQKKHGFSSSEVILHQTPFTFDISAIEILGSLFAGATLVMAQPGQEKNPNHLCKLIRENAVTVLNVVPATLKLLLQEGLFETHNSLKQILCGGDALKYELLEAFKSQTDIPLYNYYGPTETSIYSTCWEAQVNEEHQVFIGSPIANTQICILDGNKRLVPQGMPGELHIGGVGVAIGYLNASELTASKFFYSEEVSSILYATGDIAKLSPDGKLVFLGRKDHQAKLQGHRLELDEIDYYLVKHPSILEACTLIKEDIKLGTESLSSYVVAKKNSAEINDKDLREWLKLKLPEYMIPKAFCQVSELPLNINGKVDRKALLEIDSKPPKAHRATWDMPASDTENKLIEIWQALLKREVIAIEDNFFDSGGDSLLAIHLNARIEKTFNVSLGLKHIFESTTIKALAGVIDEKKQKLLPQENADVYPTASRLSDKNLKNICEEALINN